MLYKKWSLVIFYVGSTIFFFFFFFHEGEFQPINVSPRRLTSLGFMSLSGHLWMTLVVELLNGLCYGIGYTAIIIYVSLITPPGTSATVQSVVNICYEAIGELLLPEYWNGNEGGYSKMTWFRLSRNTRWSGCDTSKNVILSVQNYTWVTVS